MSIDKQRENFVYLAKLAEQAERYKEMVDNMKSVARLNVDLTVEERTLLSVGYKKMIGAKRDSWRKVSSSEHKEETIRPNGKIAELIKEFRLKIEGELHSDCEEMLSIIDNNVLPNTLDAEAKVFFLKLKGDCHRYLAEFTTHEEKMRATEGAKASYQEASLVAKDNLVPNHPIRLGLALNYAIFHYEILQSRLEAIMLAKQAFDDAIAKPDHLNDESNRDTALIIKSLRDNLTLWTSLPLDDGGEDGNKSYPNPKDLPED